MDWGGFFIFNFLCDKLDKFLFEEPDSLITPPMPTHIKVALAIAAVCVIATIIIISATL